MDLTSIVVAGFALVGTCVGSLAGMRASNKLIEYRIKKLEEKVQVHNNVVVELEKAKVMLEDHDTDIKDLQKDVKCLQKGRGEAHGATV